MQRQSGRCRHLQHQPHTTLVSVTEKGNKVGHHRQWPYLQEIPTYHVQPLHPKCDTWCEFPVADRPNAVKQFLAAATKDTSLIKAPWILLIETDYVWMTPLQQIPAAESGDPGLAFPYGYIQPAYPGVP